MQPVYMAERGIAGIATSMAMLGRFREPDLKVCVLLVVPVVVELPNAAFSQKPKASALSGTVMSPSAVTAFFNGASASRP